MALRSSVLVVFNNFLLIDATDRSKISRDQKRFLIALSLYIPHFIFREHFFNHGLEYREQCLHTSSYKSPHLSPDPQLDVKRTIWRTSSVETRNKKQEKKLNRKKDLEIKTLVKNPNFLKS